MRAGFKQAVKYAALPGIIPRLKGFELNFPYMAYLMALVFAATRILPAWHPYVRSSNMGTYGIRDVLTVAGRELKGGWRNIDQYIVYISFVLGLLLLLAQFIILLTVITTHTAEAFSFKGIFNTPVRENDVALMMLDRTFQVPGIFGSKFMPANANDITAFSAGLQSLFGFYNYGILVIAGLIVVYFLFAVTVETVETGTPFGQRFNEVYVPMRLILALILLVPVSFGLSAGQHLVLRMADWGSGFATNGWLLFNQRVAQNPLGMGAQQLLVNPQPQDVDDLLRFNALVHSCRAMYQQMYQKDIQPYIVSRVNGNVTTVNAFAGSYADAIAKAPASDIQIIYGEKNASFTKLPGQVKDYCGKLSVTAEQDNGEPAYFITEAYWNLASLMWKDIDLRSYGDRTAASFLDRPASGGTTSVGWPQGSAEPNEDYYAELHTVYQSKLNSNLDAAMDKIEGFPESQIKMDQETLDLGWGGAGLWFNRIAEYNGSIVSANTHIPVPASLPRAMYLITANQSSANQGASSLFQFLPSFGNGLSLTEAISGAQLDDPAKDGQIASYLDKNYSQLTSDEAFGNGSKSQNKSAFGRVVTMLFGLEGIYELRGNQEVHPMAKMAALGRGIIERSITFIGGTFIMGGLSGIGGTLDRLIDPSGASHSFAGIFEGFNGLLVPLIMLGITAGFILYYILPLMPFMYFFLAVGRWVKGIFEALVAVPLWALAHLRIDGDGIPGPAAANGYLLLLEIVLRPIMTLFGLMAAVSCFSALAVAMDTLFDLAVTNVAGHTTDLKESGEMTVESFRRNEVDQFFYTLMYAILLYLMATSCFKLIDLIPNNILRFLGSQVAAFADKSTFEAESMTDIASKAGYFVADDVPKATFSLGQAAGRGVGQVGEVPADIKSFMDSFIRKPDQGGGQG